MICCNSEDECEKLFIGFKSQTIGEFLKLTNRCDKNSADIGKYNNNLVIILNGKYSIINEPSPKEENKLNKVNSNEIIGIKNKNSSDNIQKTNNQIKFNQNNQQNGPGNFINNQIKNIGQAGQIKLNNLQRKEIVDLLNIIIDIIKLNIKINHNWNKDSALEEYYPINFEWLTIYLDCYNLKNLFYNQIIYKIIYNIITKAQKHLTNDEVLFYLQSSPDIKDIINKIPINNQMNNNILNQNPIIPQKVNINNFYYYKNFILVQEKTMKFIRNNIDKKECFNCYIKENKIIVGFNHFNFSLFLVEVYYIDNNNIVNPEMIFKFYKENDLINCMKNLKQFGYSQFITNYLIFINSGNYIDFVSPIIDKNNKEIGYAFKYNSNINDYAPYIINQEYKTMIKLFFNYIILRTNPIDKKYYLVNEEFIKTYKEHFDYFNLKKILQNNQYCLQVANNLKSQRDFNLNQILNDRLLVQIIKNLPFDINQRCNEKSKIQVKADYIKREQKFKNVQNTEI